MNQMVLPPKGGGPPLIDTDFVLANTPFRDLAVSQNVSQAERFKCIIYIIYIYIYINGYIACVYKYVRKSFTYIHTY